MYEFLIFMFSNVWRGLAFIVCFAILVDGIVDLVKAIRRELILKYRKTPEILTSPAKKQEIVDKNFIFAVR